LRKAKANAGPSARPGAAGLAQNDMPNLIAQVDSRVWLIGMTAEFVALDDGCFSIVQDYA
jgi:hypothetical protein